MNARQLRIVTHKKWLVDTFAGDEKIKNDSRIRAVVQDFGFDIDSTTVDDSWWWCPGAWVSSVVAAGVVIPLASCGITWMERLPREYTRRFITTCSIEQISTVAACFERVFIKLPEAKIDYFPARTIAVNDWSSQTLQQTNVPGDTLVQVSEVVDFVTEARFFVADRRIVAESLYRMSDVIWGSDEFATLISAGPALSALQRLRSFAEQVITDDRIEQPRGWVLDVGELADGGTTIVEANAAWSSGPYECEPSGVLEALIASQSEDDGVESRWQWRPGDVYQTSGALSKVYKSSD